jgi:nucleoside-diphosphate-sugar epimerase
LLTGGTGFIGSAVLNKLVEKGIGGIVLIRKPVDNILNFRQVVIDDITSLKNHKEVFNCDVVIHCAATAHNKHTNASDIFSSNVNGAVSVAEFAFSRGMKRFVFVSSILVNGESSVYPFTESDQANPISPFAESKLEAELALKRLSIKLGFELVIVRPPLVVGRGAPANFNTLINLVMRFRILPFGLLKSKRSVISLENLAEFLILCSCHKKASNQVFLIADPVSYSICDLTSLISASMGTNLTQAPVPSVLFYVLDRCLPGISLTFLIKTLEIDSSKACCILGWESVISTERTLNQLFE